MAASAAAALASGSFTTADLIGEGWIWKSGSGGKAVSLSLSNKVFAWQELVDGKPDASTGKVLQTLSIVSAHPSGTQLRVVAYPHDSKKGCCGSGSSEVLPTRSRHEEVFLFTGDVPSAAGGAGGAASSIGSSAEACVEQVWLWAASIEQAARNALLPAGVPLQLKGTALRKSAAYSSAAAGAAASAAAGASPITPSQQQAGMEPQGLCIPAARKLLVFINPASGAGHSEKIWDEDCAPIICDARCTVDKRVTSRMNEARETVSHMPAAVLLSYDGIIGVGGDGILAEICQGLMERKDWASAVEEVTLGIIPGGSGNGLVCSLLAASGLAYSPANAALLIAKNAQTRMDIASTFLAAGNAGPAAAAVAAGSGAVVGAGSSSGHQQRAAASAVESGKSRRSSDCGGAASLSAVAPSGSSAEEGLSRESESLGVLVHDGDHHQQQQHSTSAVGSAREHGAGSRASASASHPSLTALPPSSPIHGSSSAGQLARYPGALWGEQRLQFLSTSWGIISDLDIESESLRCLGNARFDVYGAIRAVCLRKYRGRLSFLAADKAFRSGRRWHAEAANKGMPEEDLPSSFSSSVAAAAAAAGTLRSVSSASGSAGASSVGLGKDSASSASTAPAGVGLSGGAAAAGGAGSGAGPSAHDVIAAAAAEEAGPGAALPPLRYLTPFDHPVPLSWTSIEGLFTLLWITNTTHQSIGVAAAAESGHDDGLMTITLVRDCSCCTMLQILTSLDDQGSISKCPGVETFTCVAFRLEPELDESKSRRGHISLDGEDVAYGPIQAEVHPSLLRVFGPPTKYSQAQLLGDVEQS